MVSLIIFLIISFKILPGFSHIISPPISTNNFSYSLNNAPQVGESRASFGRVLVKISASWFFDDTKGLIISLDFTFEQMKSQSM